MERFLATVVSNNEIMPGTHLLRLEAPQIAAAAQPGQFVMVRCRGGALLRRPFSVHQVAPESSPASLAVLFSNVGKGTDWLSRRRTGDNRMDLIGPLGNAFSIVPTSKQLLLIAGGVGIAPLAFLAQKAVASGRSVTLLAGAATAGQLYPQRLLPPEVKLILATEDGSAGDKCLVTDLVPGFLAQCDQVFACGPVAMYESLLRRCQKEMSGRSVQVSLEVRMGCGLGGCFSCTINTRHGLRRVCRDGPVFELEDVILKEVKV